jgi:hypothetical protein
LAQVALFEGVARTLVVDYRRHYRATEKAEVTL